MPSSSRTPFITIRAEGALLLVDLLQRTVDNDLDLSGLTSDKLDAYYARLFGLTRDELRYTLRVDPKEVHGEDFPLISAY